MLSFPEDEKNTRVSPPSFLYDFPFIRNSFILGDNKVYKSVHSESLSVLGG